MAERQINPKEYILLEKVQGGYPLDSVSINLAHVLGPKKREFQANVGSTILIFENGDYDIFIKEKEWFDGGRKILRHILESDENVKNWEERKRKWLDYLSNVNIEYAEKNYGNLTDKELCNEVKSIIDIETKNGFENSDIASTNYATNFVHLELEKSLNELGFEPHKTIQVLLMSTGKFPLIEYESEIGDLALHCYNNKIYLVDENTLNYNKEIGDKIKMILKEYEWLDASLVNPPKSKEKVMADINDLLSFKEKLSDILIRREEEKKKNKLEKEKLLKEVLTKASPRQRRAIHFAVISAELGRLVVDEIMKFIYLKRSINTTLAKRLSGLDIRFLSLAEIKDCLENKNKIDPIIISERKELCVWVLKDKVEIYTENKAIELRDALKANLENDKSPLKGEIAFSKGIVRGIAKLLRNASEMSKVEKGDILISSRTYPDLLPAMKRSAAIISELGGLLSHAAIVSREMQIPCLVGVRNATTRIKDGDMLEIDTEKGTIKIIEKAAISKGG